MGTIQIWQNFWVGNLLWLFTLPQMLSRGSVAVMISNMSIQACYCESFPMNTRKTFIYSWSYSYTIMLMPIATCQEKFTRYISWIFAQARQILYTLYWLFSCRLCIHNYLCNTMLRMYIASYCNYIICYSIMKTNNWILGVAIVNYSFN